MDDEVGAKNVSQNVILITIIVLRSLSVDTRKGAISSHNSKNYEKDLLVLPKQL